MSPVNMNRTHVLIKTNFTKLSLDDKINKKFGWLLPDLNLTQIKLVKEKFKNRTFT